MFGAWEGQRVLMAGDSLMENLWQTTACTAELLGARVTRLPVARFAWKPGPSGRLADDATTEEIDLTSMPYQDVPHDVKHNNDTQGLLFRLEISGMPVQSGSNGSLTLDYYRFYAFESAINRRRPKKGDHGLVTKMDTLLDVAAKGKYHHHLLNMGHNMQSRNLARIDAKVLCGKMPTPLPILVEHPPQHFSGRTGDYLGPDSSKEKRCTCNNPVLTEQGTALSNFEMARSGATCGMGVAKLWRGMADFTSSAAVCENLHYPEDGDCTHYLLSPTLWASAARAMMEQTQMAQRRA